MKVGKLAELGRGRSRSVDRDRDRHELRVAGTSGMDGLERVHVTQLVAEDHDSARPLTIQQSRHRLALAARVVRSQVHDGPTAVMHEAVVREALTGLDGRDGCQDGVPGHGHVAGLADMEGDRGSLALDEQPRWVVEFRGDSRRQPLRRVPMSLEARLAANPQRGRTTSTAHPAMLQSVVAQILDPANPDPGSDIQHGSPGQDDRPDPRRTRFAQARQDAQGALRNRVDGSGAGIARAGRERPVEVRHEEERRASSHEAIDRVGQDGRRGDVVVRHAGLEGIVSQVGTAQARSVME